MSIKYMQDIPLAGKRVLIRSDLNVPIQKGQITSFTRLLASIPTYQQALKSGARIMIMSHLGRPTAEQWDASFSLAPVAKALSKLLNQPVHFIENLLNIQEAPKDHSIILFENVRFLEGEISNQSQLAQKMADLCDVFVMDAFGSAHRAHASTCQTALLAPIACAGPLLQKELKALEHAAINPKKPLLTIVGGSKVSSKLMLLSSLAKKCDQLIVGGGIANTFLAAAGYPVGQSLYEPNLIEEAKKILQQTQIPLPEDVVVASALKPNAIATIKNIQDVASQDIILDIGPKTQAYFTQLIQKAKTIIWNGPVGVFEYEQFSHGTHTIATAIAKTTAFSIAGGGDTIAAIEKYNISDNISYISTGGGAFLEYLEGKTLPSVAALTASAR
ncbi:MAG: phosphoglycerate kinase [Endozoicomonadaceae bacterium]|nr:phosphoglycerate kinase [Endozoicomonadaceae bacterium]